MTTTALASLPLDVLEKVIGDHLDSLQDVASARLACRAMAATGGRQLQRLGRVAHLARSALKAHRVTLLVRRGLVGHVIVSDELAAIAEEEDEDEAEEVALLLVAPGAGLGGTTPAHREDRRLRRERRRAEAEALRAATRAALLASAQLLLAGAGGGTTSAAVTAPVPPPPPPLSSSWREAGTRLAALISLSPDPLVDLLSAAHHATAKAGDHPPLESLFAEAPPWPSGGLMLALSLKREQVTREVRAELAAVVATGAGHLWEDQLRVAAQAQQEMDGGGADGAVPMEAEGGIVGGGLLSSVVLLPQAAGDGSATATAATTADSSVQTTGGHFGPSLETVRLLTRDVVSLAAKTAPETLALLARCLETELRAWEGLPTPLP
jgi:hypothetical protein